jgi:hypothetical protein
MTNLYDIMHPLSYSQLSLKKRDGVGSSHGTRTAKEGS